jgi:hypothetical protein
MTEDEQAEWDVLKTANDQGKFAVPLGVGDERLTPALLRLQVRRWVTLIDVSAISLDPTHLYRIFLASDEAMTWFRRAN